MSDTTTPASTRIGGVAGILAVVLSIGGFALIGAGGFALEPGAPLSDVREALGDGDTGLGLAGVYVDTLGTLLFIVFLACLWSRIRGAGDWLPVAALASGLAMVVAGFGDKAAYYAIFSRADSGIDVGVAAALYDTATGFYNLFYALSGAFLLLVGLAALASGTLPRWLARAGVVIGAVAIVTAAAPEGGVGQTALPFVMLWIIAVAVALARATPGVGHRSV